MVRKSPTKSTKNKSTKKTATKSEPVKKAVSIETDFTGSPLNKDLDVNTDLNTSENIDEAEDMEAIESELIEVPVEEPVIKPMKVQEEPEEEVREAQEVMEPGTPINAPTEETKQEVKEDITQSFMDEINQTSGELIISNRTHFEILFSDLGYKSPDGRFDPLILPPYSQKDLELEGFTKEDLKRSKNLRNFIASGKVKLGKLEEKDKLDDTTLHASVFRSGNITGQVSIPFQGEYFKRWTEFVEKENNRYRRSRLD